MKKQITAMLAATAVLGATTAFANNPFSDVSTDSWAYQAVSQLAAAGVVNGYPDGTFKGQKEITRFEMAQKIIPESIMVGIIKINPEANMAATCVRVTEEISKPNANDTNINNSDTTINQNRLPATGTCNT